MEWIRALLQWANSNEALLWWLFATSLALFLLTPVAVAWIAVQIPSDYFLQERRQPVPVRQRHPMPTFVVKVAKNALGIVLLVMGLVMLVVPGQGLLTIAAALVLINFPGKYRLERWFVTRKPVWRSINWLRQRAGRNQLQRPA